MRLVQLLKHIKALSAWERKRLLREILALDERFPESRPARSVAQVTWPDIEVRGKRLMGDRVLPNLLLLERGEETT